MILDKSFFIRKELFIPDSVAQPAAGFNTPTGQAALDSEILRRETEVLVYALGQSQYATLKTFFYGTTLDPAAPQKWKDLVEGKVYDGKVWQGLRYKIGNDNYSFIAYYVYYHHLMENYSYNTRVGIAVPEAANAQTKPPVQSLCNAWNAFIYSYGSQDKCCLDSFIVWDWTGCGCEGNVHVTLGEFLSDFPDDYDSAFFSTWNFAEPINAWGI